MSRKRRAGWFGTTVAVALTALALSAASASAATCTYSANGNWTTGGSCGSTPANTDP